MGPAYYSRTTSNGECKPFYQVYNHACSHAENTNLASLVEGSFTILEEGVQAARPGCTLAQIHAFRELSKLGGIVPEWGLVELSTPAKNALFVTYNGNPKTLKVGVVDLDI